MKKVLVFGTFDIFHKGHEHLLNEARKLGDELIVVISRDNTVNEVKGKPAVNSQEARRKIVQSFPAVSRAVLGHAGDKYKVIEEIKPDVICLGYDQTHFTKNLASEMKKRGLSPKIVRLKSFHPEKYKSSKLRRDQ